MRVGASANTDEVKVLGVRTIAYRASVAKAGAVDVAEEENTTATYAASFKWPREDVPRELSVKRATVKQEPGSWLGWTMYHDHVIKFNGPCPEDPVSLTHSTQ